MREFISQICYNVEMKSRLQKLSQRLYSRLNPPKMIKKRRFFYKKPYDDPGGLGFADTNKQSEQSAQNAQAVNEMESAPLDVFYHPDSVKLKKSFLNGAKLFLLFSIIFFIISSVFAFYIIKSELRTVRQENISIFVKGPKYIESGELAQFQVYIENRNPAELESVDLVVEYPPGTQVPGQEFKFDKADFKSDKTVVRQRIALGNIKAGERKKGTVKARVFGQKGDSVSIRFSIEYRIRGISAIYELATKHNLKIASNALVVSVFGPDEATFAQNPSLNVKIQNTSKTDLKFVTLKAELPLGTKIISANPSASDKNTWYYKILKAGEEKNIKLNLKIDGQTGDERVIRFIAGIKDPARKSNELDIAYFQAEHKIKVARPFVLTKIKLGERNEDGRIVLYPGTKMQGVLEYENTLPYPIEDLVLVLSMKGAALDKYNISAHRGFYKSIDNIIVWDKTTVGKAFQFLRPGAKGELKFIIGIKDTKDLYMYKNLSVLFEVHAAAKRVAEANVEEVLEATSKEKALINSSMRFASRSLYFENPLKSGGPLPPKADSSTVYGIQWVVTNSTNELEDVEVSGYLPPNVEWSAVYIPASEHLNYNPTSGKITWRLGKVAPGTGYYLPARSVFFNVVLTPSVSQIGNYADLVTNQKIHGKDTFTKMKFEYKLKNTNTKIEEKDAKEFYFKVTK